MEDVAVYKELLREPSPTHRGLAFVGPTTVEVQRFPLPVLLGPTDAVVAVHLAGICGSDLHPFHAREPCAYGTVFGHELVGVVVAAGASVTIDLGTLVMCPFSAACGTCEACAEGLSARCTSSALFGWRDPVTGEGLHGGQAEYVRVPLAQGSLMALPPDVHAEEGLLIGDILSTAIHCARNAGLEALGAGAKGDRPHVVVVVGCGPVGLLTVYVAAEMLRASGRSFRLYAVDSVPARLAAAVVAGAEAVDFTACDAREVIRAAGGADAALECVGAQAALSLAFDVLRPGGILSSIGVHSAPAFPFSPAEAYDKNLTLRTGRCPARSLMPSAVAMLARFKARGHDVRGAIVSHRMGLAEGPAAYALFDARGATKVVLDCRRKAAVSAEMT